MKKLLSILTAVTLVFGLSLNAYADEVTDPVIPNSDEAGNPYGNQDEVDWTSVIFKKSITTIANEGALHPTEKFSFTITPESAKDEQGETISSIPAFAPTTFDIEVDAGEGDKTKTITLPTYSQVGTYVYKVQETESNTAGMIYDSTEYTFTVIVINDGNGKFKRLILRDEKTNQKTDVFSNNYKAGSLIIKKEIKGNNANFAETFPVKVTFTPEDEKTIKSAISNSLENAENIIYRKSTDGKITVTFDVTNGSTVTLKNIPYGTKYKVEEIDSKNYIAEYSNETGTIKSNDMNVEITNTFNREIDTGIALDSIPYVLLLAGAIVGLGAMLKKRKFV